jgi:hypothetical protein
MPGSVDSPHALIASDRVEGTDVYSPAGDKLGTIDHLMIDKLSGRVRCAVLEFGGFLGIGDERYPLPWEMLTYDVEKEGFVVPLDKAKLEGAPKYRAGERPEWDRDYDRSIGSYYGVPLV